MSELTQNTAVAAVGINRLLEQYKGTSDFKRLLEIYLESVQDLEDAAWGVWLGRMLPNAVGAQLDVLGSIVGEPRKLKSDELYKIWIAVRIRVNQSFGKPDDIIACIQLATDKDFELREYADSAFAVIFDETPDFPNDVQAICFLAKAGGVHLQVIYPGSDSVFRFRNDGDPSNPDLGFADGS